MGGVMVAAKVQNVWRKNRKEVQENESPGRCCQVLARALRVSELTLTNHLRLE